MNGRYIVHTKDNKERCLLHKTEYVGKFMDIRVVNSTLNSTIAIDFKVGDYITYRGEVFILNNLPTIKKTSRWNYSYSLQFVSYANELLFCVFKDVVKHDNKLIYPNHRQVSFTGDVTYLTDRIQANLDEVYKKDVWKIHVSEDVDKSIERNISVQSSNCWNALTLVYTEYGVSYFIKGRDIYVGYKEDVVDKVFKYGKGNGVYTLERIVKQDESVITKMLVTGSSRNLDSSYPKLPEWKDSVLPVDFFFSPLTLMLPSFKKDGKTDFIIAEQKHIDLYGLREGSVVIEDVYPSITGSVNDKGKPIDRIVKTAKVDNESKYFEVWINNVDFKDSDNKPLPLKEQMIPTKSKMVMKTGSLQGFGFFIIQVHENEKNDGLTRLVLERNTSSDTIAGSEESFTVPNSSLTLKADDEFVFIEIFMPQSYIRQAENRLKAEAEKRMMESLKPDYTYAVDVSDIFMKQHNIYADILEGQRLHVIDEPLGVDESIVIETLSIVEGDGLIPKFKITLNNNPSVSTKQVLKDQIDSVEGTTTNNYKAIDELTSILRRKLNKDEWDRAWEIIKLELGKNYVLGKLPIVGKYGVTMYADTDYLEEESDHKDLYDGLAIDNKTIKRRADGVLYAEIKEVEIPEIPSVEDMATMTWVKNQKYLTKHQDISNLATKESVPTKTSDLTNDSGFLTQHQDVSGLERTINDLKKENKSLKERLDVFDKMWEIKIVNGVEVVYSKMNIITDGGLTILNEE